MLFIKWAESQRNLLSKPNKNIFRIWAAILTVAAGIVTTSLFAQTAVWPSKSVSLVVGTPAGGAIDAYARTLADQLSKQTGVTFLVDNRAGAGGNLSAEHVLKSPADGHSLWVTTHAMFTINPSAYLALRWKQADFKPIAKGVESPFCSRYIPRYPRAPYPSSPPGCPPIRPRPLMPLSARGPPPIFWVSNSMSASS